MRSTGLFYVFTSFRFVSFPLACIFYRGGCELLPAFLPGSDRPPPEPPPSLCFLVADVCWLALVLGWLGVIDQSCWGWRGLVLASSSCASKFVVGGVLSSLGRSIWGALFVLK
ncbi:hypothetical protein TSUD_339700 [Trifolium subterraneum]|nr:hypothetical protein TSUD_339700 [Trifolium subterraneum]